MTKGVSDFDIFFKEHPFPSWICDEKNRIVDVNYAAVSFFGYTIQEFTQLSLDDLLADKKVLWKKDSIFSYDQISFQDIHGKVYSKPLTIKTATRNSIVVEIYTIGPQSNDTHLSNVLVKEIHHRVKNNLQLISSIIYFKSISVESPDFRAFLDNMRQRIKSLALIHERLLQSENLNRVEISDYLGRLLFDIKASQQTTEKDIRILSTITPHLLPLDTAIFCGLIVNELVTNSLKHAFADRQKGNIELIFEKNERYYQLKISDDGVSLPEEIVPGKSESFGMQMLTVFVKQINGKLELNRSNGTSYLLQFPFH